MNTNISKLHKSVTLGVGALLGLGLLSAQPAAAQTRTVLGVQGAPVGLQPRVAFIPGTTTLAPGQFGMLPNNFNRFGFPGSEQAPNIVGPGFQPIRVGFGTNGLINGMPVDIPLATRFQPVSGGFRPVGIGFRPGILQPMPSPALMRLRMLSRRGFDVPFP